MKILTDQQKAHVLHGLDLLIAHYQFIASGEDHAYRVSALNLLHGNDNNNKGLLTFRKMLEYMTLYME